MSPRSVSADDDEDEDLTPDAPQRKSHHAVANGRRKSFFGHGGAHQFRGPFVTRNSLFPARGRGWNNSAMTFSRIASVREPAPSTLGDNYILGPGDRVLVILRGAQNRSQAYPVGDDGKLVVEDIQPISAAGRSLGDVAREVEQDVAARILDTQAYVSLAQLRAVNVQVLGEVARPGRQTASAYGGVMDALNAAGGVRKTGSLRRIQLSRARRHVANG